MSDSVKNEKPEVYALRQDGGNWQISRRDFLKAAGIGAAAMGAGLSSGCSRTKPLDDICGNVTAHANTIKGLITSADGKYLISLDSANVIKCWDFEKQSLYGSINQSFRTYTVGYRCGKSSLFLHPASALVYYCELPLQQLVAEQSDDRIEAKRIYYETHKKFNVPSLSAERMVMDSAENMYASRHGRIEFYSKADDYQHQEILYEPNSKRDTIESIELFGEEKHLFVLWSGDNGFGVFDLRKKAMSYYNDPCSSYALLNGKNQALICYRKEYKLVLLDDHSNIWTQDSPKPGGGSNYEISAAAVTPDGTVGILLVTYQTNYYLYTISISDGSRLNEYSLSNLVRSGDFSGPVVSRDGSKLAVSVNKTIFFFSLPDMKLIGCPVDMDEAKDNVRGVEISAKDTVTGETYTYTLPCGAALPEGAVCTCNCVTGRGGCSCVGHSNSGGGGGSHYWHPN